MGDETIHIHRHTTHLQLYPVSKLTGVEKPSWTPWKFCSNFPTSDCGTTNFWKISWVILGLVESCDFFPCISLELWPCKLLKTWDVIPKVAVKFFTKNCFQTQCPHGFLNNIFIFWEHFMSHAKFIHFFMCIRYRRDSFFGTPPHFWYRHGSSIDPAVLHRLPQTWSLE